MSELHADILSHARREETGVTPQPIQGITVHDSDILQPEPPRPGGLVRKDIVCYSLLPVITISFMSCKQHTFRQPAKPLAPPTPRTSLLGLDRLAQEKRAALGEHREHSGDGNRKRPRYDEGQESLFKGESPHIQIQASFIFLCSACPSCASY